MKKFFSLVLALVMALSLTTVAWGADATVDNAADFKAKMEDTDTSKVTLGARFDLSEMVTIPVGKTITLDLASYTITGTDTTSANFGLITVSKGASLTVMGNGTITLTATTDRGWNNYSAVIANNQGTVTIKGGTFQHLGGTSMAYGVDNLTNGNIGDAYLYVEGGSIISTYRAIRQFANSTSCDNVVSVTGGTVEGDNCSLWVQNPNSYANNADTAISGGSFTGAIKVGTSDNIDAVISGGSFDTDVTAYLADDVQLLANGSVVPETTAGDTSPVLYVWDDTAEDWLSYYIATGEDVDDMAQDSSDNCLPCYLVDGEYFVEVKEAAATYKLVYGAKTVYLSPVAAKYVKYVDTASVLTVVDADDAECGDYYIANLDEDDVYYISYDKKGVVDGLYVATKNGSKQILVGTKIVDAEVAPVSFMFHTFKGYDVVNNEYTTVKCSECDKVAKLYANATAATVGKKDAVKIDNLGWVTFADYMDFGPVASGKPSTDKTVTSAETFDAGIAIYVGMSVLAATGSAVVIGKKD